MNADIQQTLGYLGTINSRLQERFEKLKEELQDSHQTLEQIIAHMSDGLIFITLKGVVTLFNSAAEHLTGYRQEELLGAPYWDFFFDDLFGFSMRGALTKSAMTHHRIFLTLNEIKEVEISSSSIPNRGILLLLRDRTELQKLEMSAHHSDRLKELGEMAATLAHEIRNPLGGIEGFAELLKRDLSDPSHQRMLRSILEGTRILNRLVTNVLEYGRPLTLHFTTINLPTLVEEVLASTAVSQYACKCSFHSDVLNCPISADRDQLKLSLLNLLRNALEASSTNIEINFKGGVLSIQDNGIGISQKEIEKVFTPFFTSKSSGTGLGLAEVYRIVQAHGWEISLDSTEGEGTRCQLKIS